MDATVLHALGKPPRFEQFPEPTLGDGEVLVHVRAAALKPVDKQMAAGALIASTTHGDLALRSNRVRLVEVGESAGPTISLRAGVLRSSGLEMIGSGTGTIPPRKTMIEL